MQYSTIIGLEVHVQLLTQTKLFCGCSTRFGDPPNSNTCPVCLGMPGALPVMNRRAFELALKTAVALHCDIAEFTKWDRKNYYYPDLPKNYQISQYDLPFSSEGYLDIPLKGGEKKRVGIIRAHLEEDAGKLLHSDHGGDSQVDLNRAGTPLLEIVSKPDLTSPEEAKAYLEELKLLLHYLGVSDCNMQEGSLRCDANVNIHVRRGNERIATPIVEVKNMNSFRAVERAMLYEVQRHYEEWQRTGQKLGDVAKETRGWDDPRGMTVSQRRKEEASDYRYFPEPDLVPVVVDAPWLERVRESLGELPADRRDRIQATCEISDYDAAVIVEQGAAFADYFEELVRASGSGKMASNWVQQDVLRSLNEQKQSIASFSISAAALGELIGKVDRGEINTHTARDVFAEMLASGRRADEIIQERGLAMVSDADTLRAVVVQVLDANPKVVTDFQKGKKATQVEGFVRGLVMKQTKGAANPKLVGELVAQELARRV